MHAFVFSGVIITHLNYLSKHSKNKMKTIRKGKTRLDLIMPKYSSSIKCTERIGKTRSRINNSQPKKHWK